MMVVVPSSAVADSRPDEEDSPWTHRLRGVAADQASGSAERGKYPSGSKKTLERRSMMVLFKTDDGSKRGKKGGMKSERGEVPPTASKSSKK